MNNETTIFVSGYITSSHLIEPKRSYGYEDKYIVSIVPDDPTSLMELERTIEELKYRDESPYTNPDTTVTKHKDVALEGCNIVFSSLHKPYLKGELSVDRDDQLLYKHISCLGNLQRMPDGNYYIGMSQIYSSPEPKCGLDDELSIDDGF
jgi:hypothetical protein